MGDYKCADHKKYFMNPGTETHMSIGQVAKVYGIRTTTSKACYINTQLHGVCYLVKNHISLQDSLMRATLRLLPSVGLTCIHCKHVSVDSIFGFFALFIDR